MIGLLDVQHVLVPNEAALKAHLHLQQVGKRGHEGFVLWAGTRNGDVFQVQHTIIPAQRAIRTSRGVCVRIDAQELHRINVWQYEHQATLIAQLHSHPGRAYHSETDDHFPIATVVGSLSLVIPDFARQPFSLSRCAVYRLSVSARWLELSRQELDRLITITD